MTGNHKPPSPFICIGYCIWFIALIRIMFLSTGSTSSNIAENLGTYVGLSFWLLSLSLIPYFIARVRAQKTGDNISWLFVMFGMTLISLLLSIGGFYGRTRTNINASSATASAAEATSLAQHQQPDIESNAAPTPQISQAPQLTQEPEQEPRVSAFQCGGSYTQYINGSPQETTLNGVSARIGDDFLQINGAVVFDGNYIITNKIDSGVGFRSANNGSISGFFNRFSGQLNLMYQIGPKNPDGSINLFSYSILSCRNANPIF